MIENGRINVAYILLALHKFYRFVISNKLDTKKFINKKKRFVTIENKKKKKKKKEK